MVALERTHRLRALITCWKNRHQDAKQEMHLAHHGGGRTRDTLGHVHVVDQNLPPEGHPTGSPCSKYDAGGLIDRSGWRYQTKEAADGANGPLNTNENDANSLSETSQINESLPKNATTTSECMRRGCRRGLNLPCGRSSARLSTRPNDHACRCHQLGLFYISALTCN